MDGFKNIVCNKYKCANLIHLTLEYKRQQLAGNRYQSEKQLLQHRSILSESFKIIKNVQVCKLNMRVFGMKRVTKFGS